MGCNLIHCKFAGMTIEEANRTLNSYLSGIYVEREALSISSLVMEHLTGMSKGVQLLNKMDRFTDTQANLFRRYLTELLNNRPVQYILEEAWFGPYPFFVDERVLIPRPETEELVDWLLKDSEMRKAGTSLIDIGTGSGCIAIYVKKKERTFRPSLWMWKNRLWK